MYKDQGQRRGEKAGHTDELVHAVGVVVPWDFVRGYMAGYMGSRLENYRTVLGMTREGVKD